VSLAPRSDFLRVTIQDFGDGSARAAVLKADTRALVEGPYGRLTNDCRTKEKLVFIAAGTGIAPIRALAEEMPYDKGNAMLIYRVSDPGDVLFGQELTELTEQRSLKLHVLPGPRRGDDSWLPQSAPPTQSDSEFLRLLVPDLGQSDIYLCGPPEWMSNARTAAIKAGIPHGQLHTEEFAW
jgi:ferredoxin-NADP reductase